MADTPSTALTPSSAPEEPDALSPSPPSTLAAQYRPAFEDAARAPEKEIGSTGLQGAEPYNGWLYEEFLPQLRGLQGAKKFREMGENDPVCGAALYAMEMLIRNCDWRIDAADKSAAALEAAERVNGMLFHDMAEPFAQIVDEATSMLQFGYAPHEIIWKRCLGQTDDELTTSNYSDGMIVPASMPIRSQETIWRWIFDTEGHGRLLGLEQFRIGAPNSVIPVQKMLLFRTWYRRNNPEGLSVLRRSFTTYQQKQTITQAEGRLAIRSAGIVQLKIPAEFMPPNAPTTGPDAATYIGYKAMAERMAQDRQGSYIVPSDRDDKGNALYEVSYTTADSRKVQDFSPIIDRQDSRMAMSMLADFLMLGTKNVGSWALANSKTSMFVLATEGYNGVIADQINFVLLPRVWRANGLDPRIMPKIKPGSVQKPDIDRIGTFLRNLAGAGIVFTAEKGNTFEQWLLAQLGAPGELDVG